MTRFLVLCGLLGWLSAICNAAVDFARDVQPILHARCASCHGRDNPQGSLSVLTRADLLKGGKNGPAIVPKASQKSLLIQRVSGRAGLPRMPLAGQPLQEQEVRLLSEWIDEGAEWRPDLSVIEASASLAISRPDLPQSALAHPVDRFVESYLRAHGRAMPDPVGEDVFIRRVYLDTSGLLPTPEERESFLAENGAEKRTRLIDRLLANRTNYAEHWISYWNDLLHNDEGVRYSPGSRESISDWLLKALKDNLPYNQMVAALLNPVGPGSPKGYLVGISWGGDASASQSAPMQAAQNSAQVFLGANLKCASCHDSFVSRWKLAQTFGLAAFFSEKPLEIVRCDVATGKQAMPQFLFPEIGAVQPASSLDERRAQIAHLFTSEKNGRFSRTIVNRVWKRLFGRGLVEPVDDMDSRPWYPALLDWLACDFVEHGYDLQHLLRRILTSRTYQMPAIRDRGAKQGEYVFSGPLYRRLTAEQFADGVFAVTGEWQILDDKKGNPGVYARQWRFKADPLARALGRPDRRQVVTERASDATTLQALELVNGEEFTGILHRGAQRMLGELKPAPDNVFDSGLVSTGKATVDIDISGASQLRLLETDMISWAPNLVVYGWMDAELIGPGCAVKLTSLPLAKGAVKRLIRVKGEEAKEAVSASGPSELVYDISGKGFTRFRASVGLDESSLRYEIGGKARFFVFTAPPDPKQLVRVTGSTPVPRPPAKLDPGRLIQRLYQHAVSRDPSAMELKEGRQMLRESGADGLEDLLWIAFLSPEFQFIR